MTAFGSIESAVEAMRLGAYDYVTKPFKEGELLHRVERALERAQAAVRGGPASPASSTSATAWPRWWAAARPMRELDRAGCCAWPRPTPRC